MKIAAIVEARMTSSRLPGKVLLEACGKPMLEILINRLKLTPSLHEIVLATTSNPQDDILEDFAKNLGIKYFRGSETDVMGRVIGAAKYVTADLIVEITGDCPLIDSELVEQTIQMYQNNNADYVSNSFIRSYPDGMDVQVYSLKNLELSYSMTNDPLDREHVTLHMYSNPTLFSKLNLIAPPELNWPELGLTLDEKADYIFLKKILENFHPNSVEFKCLDIIKLLKENPDWLKINYDIKRKGIS